MSDAEKSNGKTGASEDQKPGGFFLSCSVYNPEEEEFEEKVTGFSFNSSYTSWIYVEMQAYMNQKGLNRPPYNMQNVSDDPAKAEEKFTIIVGSQEALDQLMSLWRAFFVEKFGEENVGPVTEVPEDVHTDRKTGQKDTQKIVAFLNAEKAVGFVFSFPKKIYGFSLPYTAARESIWGEMQDYIEKKNLEGMDDTSRERGFGVHDISGARSNDSTAVIIGYDSYEVETRRIPKLMNLWRDFFVQKFGEADVGPIKEIPKEIYDSFDQAKKTTKFLGEPAAEENPFAGKNKKDATNGAQRPGRKNKAENSEQPEP